MPLKRDNTGAKRDVPFGASSTSCSRLVASIDQGRAKVHIQQISPGEQK
jgi:hypothetical protein